MSLIERYLQAVKFWLPKAQQEDIAAELQANILATAEDRAAELGRPLEEEEEAAILKKLGPPPLVAARYRPDQGTVAFGRQLIGPLLYPFYRAAVKATLALLALWQFFNLLALVLSGRKNMMQAVAQSLWNVLDIALLPVLLVTLLFAILDHLLRGNRIAEKWDPRTLPPLHENRPIVPRSTSIAGLVVHLVFILWWLSLPNFSEVSFAQVRLMPIWQTFYQPVLLISLIMLAQNAVNLVRPNWSWLPPLVGFVTSVVTLAILYPLIETQSLVFFDHPEANSLDALKAARLNTSLHYAILITWLGILIHAFVEAAKCVKLARNFIARPVASRASTSV